MGSSGIHRRPSGYLPAVPARGYQFRACWPESGIASAPGANTGRYTKDPKGSAELIQPPYGGTGTKGDQMQKPRTKKRWMWMAVATGLTLILLIAQSLSGAGRSRKMKKM